MRAALIASAALLAFGASTCTAATIAAYGSVTASSTDPSQRAEIRASAPAWVGIAKPIGLVMMAIGAVGVATAIVFRRK